MIGVRRLRLRHPLLVFGTTLALLALVLGVVATVDHRSKRDEINAASETTWFCVHHGIHCGRQTPEDVEAEWVERERWYTGGATALLLAAPVGLLLLGRGSPRRRR